MLLIRPLIAACLFVSTVAAQEAPKVNPKLISYRWPARWIGHAAGPYRDFGVFHFRKSFTVERVPASFIIHVSADNRYRLFVNGTSVSIGPARSDLDHWRFETVDVAKQLKPGRNVLAAVVWNFGIWSPMAQLSERAGLIVQGDTDQEQIVNTGPTNTSGWKSVQNTAYQAIPIPREAVPYFYVVGPGERIDAAKYPWGWEQPEYDDSSWSPVAVWGPGQPNELFQWNESRWLLTPRPIPPMEETPERLEKVVRFTGANTTPAFVSGKAPIRIPANTKAVVLFDRGHLTTAYPELSIAGGKGAEIKLTYAESLRDAQGRKGNRNETEGKQIRSNYDIFIADGNRRVLKTLFWRTYRYLQFDIETRGEPLEVLDYKDYFSAYPVPRQASFESPNTELQKMLEIGWRTHRVCQNETYFDTPQYEQLPYAGDGRLQSMISLTNMWDDRIVRNHLDQFWYSTRPEGMIQDRYPSREPQYIPSYGLDWIHTMHDFWMYRGDEDFLRKFLPVSRAVIDWYLRRLDGNNVVRDLSWADEKYEGVQNAAEHGPQARNQLELIFCLMRAAELETAFGSEARAERYRALIPVLKRAAFETFWVADKGLLARNRDRKDFDQHCIVLGVLADVIPPDKQRAALEYTIDRWDELPRVRQAKSGFFFFYFRHEAMEKAGIADRMLQLFDPWREQMKAGFTTWGEGVGLEPRSDSHAWSAAPNVQVFTVIAGIRPTAPGFRAVSIRPHLNGLPWVKATVPHPQGEIHVELTAAGPEGLKAEVVLPEGIGGSFEWRGKTVALHGGRQSLQF
jgi:alpha-L-rhamnosidase